MSNLPRSSKAWPAAAMALCFYLAWLASTAVRGVDPAELALPGTEFLTRAGSSPAITATAQDLLARHPERLEPVGYDGQWSLYIALDPVGAPPYVDVPAYRYTRILQPALAWALGLGRRALVPWTLVALNVLAVAASVLLLGVWLERRGLPAWAALLYAGFGGIVFATEADLTEPVSLALVLAALTALDRGGERRWIWASGLFALAALAREATLVFPAGLLLLWPLRRLASERGGPGVASMAQAAWLAVPFVCVAAWKAALRLRFGDWGSGPGIEPVPLRSVVVLTGGPGVRLWTVLATLVAPPLALMALAVARRRLSPALVWLALGFLLNLVFVNVDAFIQLRSGERLSDALVLSGLLLLPELRWDRPPERLAATVSLVAWMSVAPLFVLQGFGFL